MSDSLFNRLEPLLRKCSSPSRYINQEIGSAHYGINDGAEEAPLKTCLIYPDTYEVGLPNQAITILYRILNAMENVQCERSYLPWTDMISAMRENNIPLFSLESMSAVSSFDLIGFTLPHELAVTNILEALDLSNIPLLAESRTESDPIILGGGPCAFNPEPLAPFFDAIFVGEGEEAIAEIAEVLLDAKKSGLDRDERLLALSKIDGLYIPSFYEALSEQLPDKKRITTTLTPKPAAPPIIRKRVLADFDAQSLTPEPIIPYMELVHDRFSIEIQRGCTRGCRFCQSGMIYRPVRERSADSIVSTVVCGVRDSGYDEVSLASLSSTDYSQIANVLRRLGSAFSGKAVSVSIPSQRLDEFGVQMAALSAGMSGAKKSGLTFAPEAGSQRLRDVINKNVSEDDLIEVVVSAIRAGWRRLKLYFMIGLPSETDDDIRAIAEIANRAMQAARNTLEPDKRGALKLSISCSVFNPKAHTPFQWAERVTAEEAQRRIEVLRACKLERGIDLHWHDPQATLIEAAISRGGREMADLILQAWKNGARFDAWSEQFSMQAWEDAANAVQVDIVAQACEAIEYDAPLAWNHISSGIDKDFLILENELAHKAHTSEDCSMVGCIDCGVCADLDVATVLAGKR